jgi:hypothetical protein
MMPGPLGCLGVAGDAQDMAWIEPLPLVRRKSMCPDGVWLWLILVSLLGQSDRACFIESTMCLTDVIL